MTSATHSPRLRVPAQIKGVVGDGFDLVIEDVAGAVDRLAAGLGGEAKAVVGDVDVERGVERVPGLAQEDQLVEPGEQKLGRGLGVSEIDWRASTRTASRLTTM